MSYKLVIEPLAIEDIQQAIDYYDHQQIGLGEKFEQELDRQIRILSSTPHFQIRYDQVHCLPLKKYPFMIHYTIDELGKTVIIRAIFHTSQNPIKWKLR